MTGSPAAWRRRAAFGHVGALWAMAVAQPVFAVVGNSPEFFAVRGIAPKEALAAAVLLVVVPPLVLWAGLIAAERVRPGAGPRGLMCLVGLASAYLVLAGLKRLAYRVDPVTPPVSGWILLALALGAGALAAWGYARVPNVRALLGALSPAPLIVLALFLVDVRLPEEAQLPKASDVERPAPVVILVLDELPLTSLLGRDGQIDSRRFPGFARLARSSTWYPNAITSSDATVEAVPALLTGRRPGRRVGQPSFDGHPQNLFTLLRETHAVRASEVETALCPGEVCAERAGKPLLSRLAALLEDAARMEVEFAAPADFADDLPRLPRRGDPLEQFERFLGSLSSDSQPTLRFLHVELPHVPWVWLPSRQRYVLPGEPEELLGIEGAKWTAEEPLVRQGQQRHLLQTAFTDRLLGRFLDRLQQTGLYDRALVVVAADHGISFEPGRNTRILPAARVEDILPVPLFVKVPRQRQGRVDERAAELVDVFPTIMSELRARATPPVDGRSLNERWDVDRPEARVIAHVGRELVRIRRVELERRMRRALAVQLARFGEGPLRRVLASGPAAGLLGVDHAELPAGSRPVRARVSNRGAFDRVDPRSRVLRVLLRARVEGVDEGCPVAVLIHGRVAAVEQVRAGGAYSALLDPERLLPGANPPRFVAVPTVRCRRSG